MNDGGEVVDPSNAGAAPESAAADLLTDCWRCGRRTESQLMCPYCGARPVGAISKPDRANAEALPVVRVVGAYAALLVASLIYAAYRWATHNLKDDDWAGLAALEIWDGAVTFGSLALVNTRKPIPPTSTVRFLSWLGAWPVLLGLVCVGHFYAVWLHNWIWPSGFAKIQAEPASWPLILMVVVQPAVIEELFFRRLALDTFRRHTNIHGAVFLTAIMFSLAHLYNPLGMPYLFVCGLFLGYARVASGTLVLPMLLHAAHNAAILWLEAMA